MRAQSAATQQREITKQVRLVGADVSVNRQNEIHKMIARRAYESFERRGRIHGHDINDWIDAESEVVHPCVFWRMVQSGEDENTTRSRSNNRRKWLSSNEFRFGSFFAPVGIELSRARKVET